jgi:hypothetical protein
MVLSRSRKKGKSRNFDDLLKKDPSNEIREKKEITHFAYRIISKILNLVPTI